ncbi:hypothetical protein ACIOD2_27170 [Amycolatopsis sp. NPDC088138]|uniref:hypothetical protein n=1 Tax=Amycolatopsis sp. NPDC088138 TaxID=3363938 RepID=UPI00380F2111
MALADEPKITDWLSVWFSLGSGVIALLALIAAAVAVRATIQTNRTQSAQLQTLEQDRRQEQAAKFSAWLTTSENGSRQSMVYNGSGLPIHNVLLIVGIQEDPGQPGKDWKLIIGRAGTVPPTPQPIEYSDTTIRLRYAAEAIANYQNRKYADPLSDSSYATAEHVSSSAEIAVQFEDNNGVPWIRYSTGQLESRNDGFQAVLDALERMKESSPLTNIQRASRAPTRGSPARQETPPQEE